MNSNCRFPFCTASIIPAAVTAMIALSGQSFASQDVVEFNDSSRTAVSSASALEAAVEHVNPLPAPDTTQVVAEPPQMGLIPGVSGGAAGEVLPRAYGSFGIPYTSTRVQQGFTNQPVGGPHYLSSTYPYRAIGKLTFTTPDGAGWCSASLIRRSVIVTAAHCIQDFGSGTTRNDRFQFTPGYYLGLEEGSGVVAPYGTWNWWALVRPYGWLSGIDIGVGSARDNDVAVILLQKNSAGNFIGDITGYLAYGWNNYGFIASEKTGNLATAATSTLGYPGLLDRGQIMQRADGPSYLTTVGGAGQIWQGNDFTGGSSGGPWIVNFKSMVPEYSGGAVAGDASTMAVVGVTSWGSANPNAPKDNYSSQFRQNPHYPEPAYGTYGAGNIGALLNIVCNARPGTPETFAELGYCN